MSDINQPMGVSDDMSAQTNFNPKENHPNPGPLNLGNHLKFIGGRLHFWTETQWEAVPEQGLPGDKEVSPETMSEETASEEASDGDAQAAA